MTFPNTIYILNIQRHVINLLKNDDKLEIHKK